MTEKSIATVNQDGSEIAEMPTLTPMMMVQKAVEDGASMDQLERLMSMQERWEANEARKSFVTALSAFKAKPPKLEKNKEIRHKEKLISKYAGLDQVSNVIGKALHKQGLAHHWETDQSDNNIKVTCVLTHELGHLERVSLQSGPDTGGSKNSIQAIASAVTYLQRYTLLSITGMAVQDMDDDGTIPEKLVTAEQMNDLWKLMEEAGAHEGEDYNALTKFLKVSSISNEMSLATYVKATNALKDRLKGVENVNP